MKLAEPISLEEIEKTLINMKNGTSPGSDGFSVEFYKFFWKELKCFFKAMCDDCCKKGALPHSMKEGIIVLIPKPNKPRDQMKSYRPITLLNVCYKLISGSIANRLKGVLSKLIGAHQTGFLKKRFIGDNIRMIYDIIQTMNEEKLNGILISLDIEAAFDSVSWRFLREVMKKQDIPANIIRWFNALYVGSTARVAYNGHLSGEIKLSRSCRQGDALSCYLFLLVMEILANKIIQNREIKGVKLGNREHKISMYADDTVCLLHPDEYSLRALFQELGWFAKYSGLRPNLEKTNAMWIGEVSKNKEYSERKVSLHWCQSVKILGVTFENDLCNVTKAYDDKMNDVAREIGRWKYRNISLQGRVTIIKTLLLSKVSYLLLSIPRPTTAVLKTLRKMLFSFLWNGKNDKISRLTTIKSTLKGGVGMVDLDSYITALKVSWIKRAITNSNVWDGIVEKEMRTIGFIWGLGAEAIRKKTNGLRNQFWKEVMLALADLRESYRMEDDDITRSNIFFSDCTKFKCTWVRRWYESGIRTLNDLLKPNNMLMTFDEFNQTYGVKANFLDFSALISSIPNHWLTSQDRHKVEQPIIDPIIGFILSPKTRVIDAYNVLVRKKTECQNNNWEEKWESEFPSLNWSEIYLTLKETPMQYRSMKYKIITRLLVTNSLLKRMNIKNSDECEVCGQLDSIQHRVWFCQRAQNLWAGLKAWLRGKQLGILADKITLKKVILGITDDELVNHCVSAAMHIICSKRVPSISALIAILKADKEGERYNAKINNKINEHDRKWAPLELSLRDTLEIEHLLQ